MAEGVARESALRRTFAGAALAVALGLLAKLTAEASTDLLNTGRAVPISPVLCAVLLGVVWRNTIGLDARFAPGVAWVMHNILRLGIALVGLRLTFDALSSTGAQAFLLVAATITIALVASQLAARAFGLERPMQWLIGVGTAVCGCTAIAAASPAARAKPCETAVALTSVVIFGGCGMLLYPWLAHALFADAPRAAGLFLGTAIHDTSQVMGAALIYEQQFGTGETAPVAAMTKLLRNLSLLLLVPLIALASFRGRTTASDLPDSQTRVGRAQVLPAFLIAFLALAVVRIVGDAAFDASAASAAWSRTLAACLAASDLFLVCGMTTLGLGVSIQDLRRMGWRPFAAAALVALTVAVASLTLILAATR